MVKKVGRFGPFLTCSAYPKCKNIKSIEIKTGVKCPKCGEGEILERRTRRGKNFYGCNRFPKCDYALWYKPTGEKCPKCGALLVYGPKKEIRCGDKECKYVKTEGTAEGTV